MVMRGSTRLRSRAAGSVALAFSIPPRKWRWSAGQALASAMSASSALSLFALGPAMRSRKVSWRSSGSAKRRESELQGGSSRSHSRSVAERRSSGGGVR